MSDTASDTVENTADVVQDTGKPSGYDPVDLSDLPPEKAQAIENRIDYLYRQVKDNSRTVHEYRNIATEQSQKIEELMNATGRVVDHLQSRDVKEAETTLTKLMQTAFEAGDNAAYIDAQTKLIELKTKQNAPKPQAQKPQYTPPSKQGYTASQIAQDGMADGEISPQDGQLIEQWQNEKDDSGQPLRPWANNASYDPENPDPDFIKAVLIAKQVWEKNPSRSAAENLAEVDKRMGTPQRAGGQNVMGGGLTTGRKQSKVTISPKQQEIAVRTKFGGPKAKSDAEHIEAFRKQLEKVSKGGR